MLGPEERQGHEDGPRPNLVELADDLGADVAVGYAVQSTQRRGVVEHHVSQERPIDRPVRVQYRVAEGVSQRPPRRRARLDDLARYDVGVDHGPAQARQPVRHDGLARTNATAIAILLT